MRRNTFEYLHDDKELKDDEWGRYGCSGPGSHGNTALVDYWLSALGSSRVFSNDVFESRGFVSLRC